MGQRVTELTAPIKRRIGCLVVTMDKDGIEIKGYRRRTHRRFSWAQIAVLFEAGTTGAVGEEREGQSQLEQLGALPTDDPKGSNEGNDDEVLHEVPNESDIFAWL